MNSCKEFELDDLMAVTAIPVTDFRPGTAAWQTAATIARSAFSPTLSNAVTIGQQSATPGGRLIPIVKFTGKAKDQESDATAGRQHTVTVSCEVDDRDGTVWADLLSLERTPSHLLLTFRGGARAFVQADRDSYHFDVSREGAKTAVEFRVYDLMGIQLLT